jgi:hypothetical protein
MSYRAAEDKSPEFLKTNPGPAPKETSPLRGPEQLPEGNDEPVHKKVRDGFEWAVKELRKAAEEGDEDAKKMIAALDRDRERKMALATKMGIVEHRAETVVSGNRLQLGTYAVRR